MSKQALRWVSILIWAELGMTGITLGVMTPSWWALFVGLNELALAAFLVVMDHEARGKGQ